MTRPRPSALAPLAALVLFACGGSKGPPAPVPAAATADAGPLRDAAPPDEAAGEPLHLTVDAPVAKLPPPFVFGSKRATVKPVPAADGCAGVPMAAGAPPLPGDPAAEASRLGKACAAITKTRLVSSSLRGRGAGNAAAVSFPFKAQAGHCYRLYAAAEKSVTAFSVLLVDGEGAVAADGHGEEAGRALAPAAGLACFTSDDPAGHVVVSVGAGEGAFVVEIWGT